MYNVIETNNLTRSFTGTYAVRNLSVSVPEGSIFAFLGPNGAGKTTTIKMLMNILEPTSGQALVMGVETRRIGPRELARIGYVSENQKMPEWMTVGQLIDYCRPFYPQWDDAFCTKLREQFELPLDRKLRHLSRGMKVKAALLVSLAYRPRLLVLDEPFTGLDPLVRDEFIRGILELSDEAEWTVFVSSHDIDEVERLADWVGILDGGSLRLAESTADLQARFRRVECVVSGAPRPPVAQESWLGLEMAGHIVRYVESRYQPVQSEADLRLILPEATQITANPMSLREIFLALARTYRLGRTLLFFSPMNAVFHILRKDLRRVRVPLAVWLVLVALSFALIGSAIKPQDSEAQAFFMTLSYLVPLLQTVMLIVIIPLVIQEEPLAGTTAFWLTRPISRSTLLASKLLFTLVVLVLPPFAAEMIVLAANGASAHYLVLAVPEILIGNLTLITVVALVSVVTTNFGRFAIFGGVLVITACLLEFAVFWISIFSNSFMGAGATDNLHPEEYILSLMATRWLVGEVLMIAAATALIIHQYLKRWTALTISLGIASICVVLLVANAWGWNFLMPRTAMAPDTTFRAEAIKAALTGKFDVSENPSLRGTEGPTRNFSAEVAVRGVPDGYVVVDENTECFPTLADGGDVGVRTTFDFNRDISHYPPDYQALETALGGIPIINIADTPGIGGNGPRRIALFEWGADRYLQYANTPLKFTATINFVAGKYLQTAEISLKEGARFEHGSERGVITSLLHEPDGLDVAMRVSRFNLLFDLNTNHSQFDQIRSMESHEPTVVYLLLNRKRREALAENQFGADLNMPTSSGRLINRPIRISFTPRGGKSGSFELTQDWLDDATLARMEMTPVARFKVDVTASRLILEGPDKTLKPD